MGKMGDKWTKSDYIILMIAVFLAGMIGGLRLPNSQAYKQGQIDALTGNIKYELRTETTTTSEWHSIETKE